MKEVFLVLTFSSEPIAFTFEEEAEKYLAELKRNSSSIDNLMEQAFQNANVPQIMKIKVCEFKEQADLYIKNLERDKLIKELDNLKLKQEELQNKLK